MVSLLFLFSETEKKLKGKNWGDMAALLMQNHAGSDMVTVFCYVG